MIFSETSRIKFEEAATCYRGWVSFTNKVCGGPFNMNSSMGLSAPLLEDTSLCSSKQ